MQTLLHPKWANRICLLVAVILGLFQMVPAQALDKGQRRIDRLTIVTSHGFAQCPEPISCSEYSHQENDEFQYVIEDRSVISKIIRGLNELEETKQDPLWVSMVIRGYKGKQELFALCTSHHFANGYLINGRRYPSHPVLDSLIASTLIDRIKTDDFQCLSEEQDCAYEERSISQRVRDLKLLLSYFENRRYRPTTKVGS